MGLFDFILKSKEKEQNNKRKAPEVSVNAPSFDETKLILFTFCLDKIIRKEFYGITGWQYIKEDDKKKVSVKIHKNDEDIVKSYDIAYVFNYYPVRPEDISYIENCFDDNKQKEKELLEEIKMKVSQEGQLSIGVDVKDTPEEVLENITSQLLDNGLNFNIEDSKLTIYMSALDDEIEYHFSMPEITEVRADISKLDFEEIRLCYFDCCIEAELRKKYKDMISFNYGNDEDFIRYRLSKPYLPIEMAFSDGHKQSTSIRPSTIFKTTKKINAVEIISKVDETTSNDEPKKNNEKLKVFLYELIERVETTNEISFTVSIKEFNKEEQKKIIDILSKEGINTNITKNGLAVYVPSDDL